MANGVVFYACSECKKVFDLDPEKLKHVQSKPHSYFWGSTSNCEGRLTEESTQKAWENQEHRPYPR